MTTNNRPDSWTGWARRQAALCLGALACGMATGARAAETSALPTITQQPANCIMGIGEDIVLSVRATSPTPLAYQWYANGNGIGGATNDTLWMTNLPNAAVLNMAVTIANSAGMILSSNAVLTVQAAPTRRLMTGRILQVGSQVGVPIVLRATGRESVVSFSLSYNTNAYANPVFLAADTNATVVPDLSVAGTVGVTLSLPPGRMFPVGYPWVGLVRFDLAAGADPMRGGLAFATNPVPIACLNTNGLSLSLFSLVQPQYRLATTQPQLQAQSGLFIDRLWVGNPGAVTIPNLDIISVNAPTGVATNATDSIGNPILLYNAQLNLTNYPYGDPLIQLPGGGDCGLYVSNAAACGFAEYLQAGSGANSLDDQNTDLTLGLAIIHDLQPGETRQVTLEYFVSDHFTVPKPQYLLYQDALQYLYVHQSARLAAITTNRYVDQTFVVEFPTQAGTRYWIQYAATPDDLAINPQTVFPPLLGTGKPMRWIDNGPPKTASPPVDKARFYQLLEY